MNFTPQKAITSASVAAALRESSSDRPRNRPDPEFRALVIVRQDHGIAFLAQAVDLGAQIEEAGKIGGLGRHGCSSIPVIH
jgi:hypothetical protein